MSTKRKNFLRDRKAQTGVLQAGVVIIALLLVGYIGVMILHSTSEATGLDTEWNETTQTGDRMYAASHDLINTTGTVFSMYGVMVIVVIASIIIGLLLTSFMTTGKE